VAAGLDELGGGLDDELGGGGDDVEGSELVLEDVDTGTVDTGLDDPIVVGEEELLPCWLDVAVDP
jgi:hypothetical protein